MATPKILQIIADVMSTCLVPVRHLSFDDCRIGAKINCFLVVLCTAVLHQRFLQLVYTMPKAVDK